MSTINQMWSIITFVLLLQTSQNTIFSQGQNSEFCGSEILLEQILENNPELKIQYLKKQKELSKAISENRTPPQNYVLPVVFHVVHLGETIGTGSNLNDNLLLQLLNQLNQDFANLLGYGVNVPIQFCLAKVDPTGNPTSGIQRCSNKRSYFLANELYKYLDSS